VKKLDLSRPLRLHQWNRLYRKRLSYAMRKHGARTLTHDELWIIAESSHRVDSVARSLAGEYSWLVQLSRALPPQDVCTIVRLIGPHAIDTVYRLSGWEGLAVLLSERYDALKTQRAEETLARNWP